MTELSRGATKRASDARTPWLSKCTVLALERAVRQAAPKRRGKRVALSWVPDWSWGLPLLVLTVVAHVCAIVWTAKMLGLTGAPHSRNASRFVVFVALAALACAVYLGLEAAAWAGLYLWVGALPDWRDAMLYSLGSITSYGHAEVFVEDRWRLLGAIEAVNGLILFGLTTAFLYAAIRAVWPLRRI